MNLRDLLVRTYPRRWREEYGLELAGILGRKRLSLAVIADVLTSSVRQHLRQDPWKIFAVFLMIWTCCLLITGNGGLVTRPEFLCGYISGQLFLFAAAACTVLDGNSGVRQATAASLKAALVPDAACILFTSVKMLRYWGASTVVEGHSVSYWIAKNLLVTVLVSVVFGISGASLARIVRNFRRVA